MNPRLLLPALLAASLASAQPAAPDAAPAKSENPPAAAADGKTEMQKWIEATDAQWQAAYKRDVTDVHEAEAKKLMLQYLNLLEDAIGKASKAGDLDGAVALRNEQKRFGETQLFPEQDEAADPAAVKQVRTAIRPQLAKLEKDSAVRAKALHAKYDQVLAQAQAQLTQRQRLDDALLVKAKRDEVSAVWLAGVSVPVVPVAEQPKPPMVSPLSPAGVPRNAPPVAGTSSQPIVVAAELKAKGSATGPGPNTIVFDAPKGDGRRGAKGILLKNDADVAKSGSTWTFRWMREQSAQSVQIIHPIGRGQAILHLDFQGVALNAPDTWQEVGWRGGNRKAIRQTNGFEKVFPIQDGEECEVVSRMSPGGAHELFINGTLVTTGHVSGVAPFSISSEFIGDGLPLKWMPGWAAVIIGPVDRGSNRASELRFYPGVVNVGGAKR